MPRYTLTVRHRSRVAREHFDDLESALAAMERRTTEIQAEGPLSGVKAFRDYEPGDRVAARLELSRRTGLVRRSEAGLDVRGDGELVGYSGAANKRELVPVGGESVFDAVRRTLAGR